MLAVRSGHTEKWYREPRPMGSLAGRVPLTLYDAFRYPGIRWSAGSAGLWLGRIFSLSNMLPGDAIDAAHESSHYEEQSANNMLYIILYRIRISSFTWLIQVSFHGNMVYRKV